MKLRMHSLSFLTRGIWCIWALAGCTFIRHGDWTSTVDDLVQERTLESWKMNFALFFMVPILKVNMLHDYKYNNFCKVQSHSHIILHNVSLIINVHYNWHIFSLISSPREHYVLALHILVGHEIKMGSHFIPKISETLRKGENIGSTSFV